MADRYWVGGSGTWDASTTTNWSDTSGGTGGASAPTSADNVIFDSASSASGYTITVGTTANCNDITVSAPASGVAAFSLSATSGLNIYGSMLLNTSSSTWIGASGSYISFNATTTGKTITTNGITLISNATNNQVRLNGVGGEWTLGSALTVASMAVLAGTFRTNDFNLVCVINFYLGNTTAKAIYLGSSSVSITGSFNPYASSNTTFDAGTSSITITNTGAPYFSGGDFTFYNVTINAGIGMGGANTFNNLTVLPRIAAGVNSVSIGANQTINGTLTIQSGQTDPTKRVQFVSDVIGTQRTITAAAIDIQCADFRDIVGAGAATWNDSTRSKYWGDCLGNSGITFNAGRTVYWNLAGSQSWNANGWAATNNGTPNAQYFPLAQDTATFTEAGAAGTISTITNWSVGSIQMADGVSNRTTAFTLTINSLATTVYGNVTLFSNLNLTNAGPITFAGQSRTQTITSAGVTWPQPITINAPNGTVKTQDALTMDSARALTLTAGALDLNNNTLTCGLFSSSNSNTRSIAFGTGNITVTGSNATVWTTNTATGFTYTGTPTVNLTYSGSVGTRTIGAGSTAGGSESNSVSFNILSGSDAINLQTYVKNLDFTGFSGSYPALARVIYGNLILSPTMTVGAGTGLTQFFATSGTQKITTNGQTLDFPVTANCPGATLQLQDALTLGATRSFTHIAGTVDLNGKTLTAPTAYSTANSNVRAINFGNGGIISLPGSGTAFNAATATNLTTSGTGMIDMTSASAKTFAGGGASYPMLNQGGAGALTITGANTFQDITNTVAGTTVIFPAGVTTTVTNLSLAGASSTDSTATIPSNLSRLTIGGSSINSGREFNGTIKRIAYYPRRLSNATLSSLT